MKQLMTKVKPLTFVLEACGTPMVVMMVLHAALLVSETLMMKYVLDNIDSLSISAFCLYLAAELAFEVLVRLFGTHSYTSTNELMTKITAKFTELGINWRSHYTTGDIQKMYEWVNSVVKTIEHAITVVQKMLELAYAGYLIMIKGQDFVPIIITYIIWTVIFETLLMIYGYRPNEKRKYEYIEVRDRKNADLTLNINLMGIFPEAAQSLANEIKQLNKKINHCCFINIGCIIVSIVVGYIIYDVSLVYMVSSVEAVDKVKIFVLLASVCQPIFWLMDTIPEIVENCEKFKKVSGMMSREPDILDGDIRLDQLSDNFTIEFDHVSFEYEEKTKVLNDISFTIHAGERVAFVGESGCGKSTILKLLTRQIEPTKGVIRIDGIDIKKFTLKSLRETFGMISQDVEIMADSLYFNVAMAALPRKVSYDEVLNACKAALKKKVEEWAEGLDTFVGDRGVKLSGGLKQLIALARVLISRRKIIVLDEATAALDNCSEAEVLNAIDEALPNRTMIAVAHRYTTIMDYDVIHVIQNGRIAESGTYTELIEKQGVLSKIVDATIASTRRIRKAK